MSLRFTRVNPRVEPVVIMRRKVEEGKGSGKVKNERFRKSTIPPIHRWLLQGQLSLFKSSLFVCAKRLFSFSAFRKVLISLYICVYI